MHLSTHTCVLENHAEEHCSNNRTSVGNNSVISISIVVKCKYLQTFFEKVVTLADPHHSSSAADVLHSHLSYSCCLVAAGVGACSSSSSLQLGVTLSIFSSVSVSPRP